MLVCLFMRAIKPEKSRCLSRPLVLIGRVVTGLKAGGCRQARVLNHPESCSITESLWTLKRFWFLHTVEKFELLSVSFLQQALAPNSVSPAIWHRLPDLSVRQTWQPHGDIKTSRSFRQPRHPAGFNEENVPANKMFQSSETRNCFYISGVQI